MRQCATSGVNYLDQAGSLTISPDLIPRGVKLRGLHPAVDPGVILSPRTAAQIGTGRKGLVRALQGAPEGATGPLRADTGRLEAGPRRVGAEIGGSESTPIRESAFPSVNHANRPITDYQSANHWEVNNARGRV